MMAHDDSDEFTVGLESVIVWKGWQNDPTFCRPEGCPQDYTILFPL